MYYKVSNVMRMGIESNHAYQVDMLHEETASFHIIAVL